MLSKRKSVRATTLRIASEEPKRYHLLNRFQTPPGVHHNAAHLPSVKTACAPSSSCQIFVLKVSKGVHYATVAPMRDDARQVRVCCCTVLHIQADSITCVARAKLTPPQGSMHASLCIAECAQSRKHQVKRIVGLERWHAMSRNQMYPPQQQMISIM